MKFCEVCKTMVEVDLEATGKKRDADTWVWVCDSCGGVNDEPERVEPLSFWDTALALAMSDVTILEDKDREYGSSWKQRGGAGAFFSFVRKWDRIEKQCKEKGYDVFECIRQDQRPEGILDDIADLRRYLLLVETEMKIQCMDESMHIGIPSKFTPEQKTKMTATLLPGFKDSGK